MIQQRQLAIPGYLVAFSIALIPPIDIAVQVWPFQFHNPVWRYGAFGMLSNSLMMSMLGLLLCFLVSAAFEHRQFQKVLGIISALLCLLTIVALCVFVLDVLQLRGQVVPQPNKKYAFKVASVVATSKALLGIVTLLAFSYAAFRAPKAKKQVQAQRGGALLMGGSAIRQPTDATASTSAGGR